MSGPRKPALTAAVLSGISTALTLAESVIAPDPYTYPEEDKALAIASKWHREMVEWRASRNEVKP